MQASERALNPASRLLSLPFRLKHQRNSQTLAGDERRQEKRSGRRKKEEWKIILRDATFLESAACFFASSVYILFDPEDGAATTFLQSSGSLSIVTSMRASNTILAWNVRNETIARRLWPHLELFSTAHIQCTGCPTSPHLM
jgi:hypothetical protein